MFGAIAICLNSGRKTNEDAVKKENVVGYIVQLNNRDVPSSEMQDGMNSTS